MDQNDSLSHPVLPAPVSGEKVIIVGGGPAGLTAAYELCKAGVESVVLEKDNVVGGISRTVNYKGNLFDIGGHRFYTKVKAVEDIWHAVLPEQDFLRRGRLSRIYYNKKFFAYPIKVMDALARLGLWNTFLIVLSYIKAKLFPQLPEETFEQNICNRFGRRLFNIFFKSYTEKVWGISCSEITAAWANQRIRGLGMGSALKNAVMQRIGRRQENKDLVIKTLIDEFHYPRRGPGMMWERVAEIIQQQHSQLRMRTEVTKIFWSPGHVDAVEISREARIERLEGTQFISTMPIRELIQKLEPPPPPEIAAAANQLHYRDFLTVALIISQRELFPDNWIYIHDPEVQLGRIQNFKNWSPEMVADPTKTCLGLEYFCFEGDELWSMPDEKLIELGTKELAILGLAVPADVEDGAVVRMPKAYPVYDATYEAALGTVRSFLATLPNIQLVGRNGMHKYNNQDHSMLTAMLAVQNILGADYDLWQVNAEEEYHEEIKKDEKHKIEDVALIRETQPHVPTFTKVVDAGRQTGTGKN